MRRHGWALVAALALVGGCDSDGATEPPAGLAGTWDATKVEFVRVANPSQKIDVVPLGGALTLTLAETGTFTVLVAFPGDAPWTTAGTWQASSDVLTLNYTSGLSGTHQFDMMLSGNTLSLNGAHTEFEFVDEVEEDALLNLVLSRR
jgi:hypothetical protein